MRRVAVIAIVLGCGAASQAAAQSGATDARASLLAAAAFAPPQTAGPTDDIARLLEREAFAPGAGATHLNTNQFKLAPRGGAVDGVRVSVGEALVPAGGPLNLDRQDLARRGYEVTLTRDWPAAVSFGAGKVAVDVSPHAGVGMTSEGGSAEAGARMELSRKLDDKAADKLKAMGVKDGAAFGDRGRWYLFAAASGRAVGLNMLRDGSGWNRAGWTTDPASTLISDAQVGVGWRRDQVQTSLGLVHREVKGQHMIMGQDTKDDTLVAFSLSIKPRR